MYFAILPFINPGDEVLIPSPSYPNNFQDVEIMGGRAVPVLLREENNWQLSEADLEEKVTSRTKMIILTHPNNPTTSVYDRYSLELLSDFVIQHDLILVVDQAFEDYTFESEMITPAALDGMFPRTITVFSFSKGMGLSGLRVGYIVADDVIMDKLLACAVCVIGAASTSAQAAAAAALDHPEFMKMFERSYNLRRHAAFCILHDIPGVSMHMPESGFLCWLNVSGLGTSAEITAYLLNKAKVYVNDGAAYGPGGEGHIRIVLGVYRDDQKIIDALHKIRKALLAYPL